MMFQVYRKELDWGGRRLVLETGKIARQADGAVLAAVGSETMAIYLFDLRTIRRELQALNLDWSDSPLPPAAPLLESPSRLIIDSR